MQNPDLQIYDLEYSEIIGLEFRPSSAEIEMRLRCPIQGWQWKENIAQLKNRLGLNPSLPNASTLYDVSLTFLGVSELRETLLSQSQPMPLHVDESQLLALEIEDLRIVKLADGISRFYLRVDDRQLDFNYQDCIFLQKPWSK